WYPIFLCQNSHKDMIWVITYNELDLPKFPDPESRRDVRDWHVACDCKRVTEREFAVGRARPRAEA
ncbi:hypothetical protein, partial [Leptospira bandrabouensis]